MKKRKLKIGLFSDWFLPDTGGGETHVYELARLLTGYGHEVHVLLTQRMYNKLKKGSYKLPFAVHCLKSPVYKFFKKKNFLTGNAVIWWAYTLEHVHVNADYIRELGLDVLHAHCVGFGFAVPMWGHLLNIPSVITMHLNIMFTPSLQCLEQCQHYDYDKCISCKVKFYWLKKKKDRIWHLLMRGFFMNPANKIIVFNTILKEKMKKYQRMDKNVAIIPNWVDVKRFNIKKKQGGILKKCKLSEENKVLLYVGRIDRFKGIEYAIKALPGIIKEFPQVKLVVAGRVETRIKDDYDKKIRRLIRDLKLNKYIIFTGNNRYEDMPEIYSIADVLIHPTLIETQGLVLLEAMAAQLPVVTSKLNVIEDFITDSKNGLLVPVKDMKALKDAVIRVFKDQDLAKQLARNGYKTVKRRFQEKRIIPQIIKLYQKEVKKNNIR